MAASFAAQTYMRYQRETHASLERLRAGSQVVEFSGTSIEYAIAGAGLPLLISHGAAGGYDQGLAMAQPLGDDFLCVAPSRFGYLRSPLPVDAGAAAQADAYAALLDALGIQRAALIGASAGGPSAVQFALRYPDRCAALILAAAVNQAFPLGRLGIVLS
jgi:pimeloyl-ACP methyl ester carboxylesterase